MFRKAQVSEGRKGERWQKSHSETREDLIRKEAGGNKSRSIQGWGTVFVGGKGVAEAERANKEAGKAAGLALFKKQATLDKEEKEREYNLRLWTVEANDALEIQKLEMAKLHKELEFKNILKFSRID